jgi:hypothetical protein
MLRRTNDGVVERVQRLILCAQVGAFVIAAATMLDPWRCPTLLTVGSLAAVMTLPLSVQPFPLYRQTPHRPCFTLESKQSTSWRISLENKQPLECESGNCETVHNEASTRRRSLVTSAVWTGIGGILCSSSNAAAAAASAPFPLSGFGKPASQASSSLYVFAPSRNSTTFRTPLLETQPLAAEVLSSELCLLRLLPVKNRFFRELQATIEAISSVRLTNSIDTWEAVAKLVQTSGISELDRKRSHCSPSLIPTNHPLCRSSKPSALKF